MSEYVLTHKRTHVYACIRVHIYICIDSYTCIHILHIFMNIYIYNVRMHICYLCGPMQI